MKRERSEHKVGVVSGILFLFIEVGTSTHRPPTAIGDDSPCYETRAKRGNLVETKTGAADTNKNLSRGGFLHCVRTVVLTPVEMTL